MRVQSIAKYTALLSLALVIVFAAMSVIDATPALAHCDGLDGPVVGAARIALQTGDLNRVLIWVRPDDISEIRRAFNEALATRKLGPQAQELADRYFFETLVRIHRAGEGAPYTGLKPAGRNLGPAIPAADKAVETGSLDELTNLLTAAVRQELHTHFHDVVAKKSFRTDDIAAGREFIESYVTFIHYVEGLYKAATQPVAGHYYEPTTGHGGSHHLHA
ncbi:MAG: DUF6448 family protein [Pseudolabrys sp.]